MNTKNKIKYIKKVIASCKTREQVGIAYLWSIRALSSLSNIELLIAHSDIKGYTASFLEYLERLEATEK